METAKITINGKEYNLKPFENVKAFLDVMREVTALTGTMQELKKAIESRTEKLEFEVVIELKKKQWDLNLELLKTLIKHLRVQTEDPTLNIDQKEFPDIIEKYTTYLSNLVPQQNFF